MSEDHSGAGDPGTVPDLRQQSARRTGAGAGTAMEAMLRKRQLQTREPEAEPKAPEPPEAGKTPSEK